MSLLDLGVVLFFMWIAYVVLRGIFRRVRAFRFKRREPYFKAIGAYVYTACILPFGLAARALAKEGATFNSIDFEKLKSEHKFKGLSDREQAFNRIFEKEVDIVVNSIREGDQEQLDYVRDTWFGHNVNWGRQGLANVIRDLYTEGELDLSFSELKEIGTWCQEYISKLDASERAQNILTGKESPGSLDVDEYSDDDDTEIVDDDEYVDSVAYEAPEPAAPKQSRGLFSSGHSGSPTSRPAPAPTPPQRQRSSTVSRNAPKPANKPEKFTVQRLNRGGQWEAKYSSNNFRQAEQQMRIFQEGAYRLQDANQPNVRWRVVDKDGRVQ